MRAMTAPTPESSRQPWVIESPRKTTSTFPFAVSAFIPLKVRSQASGYAGQ